MNANLLYLTNIMQFLLDEAETNKRKREPTESDNAKRQCAEKESDISSLPSTSNQPSTSHDSENECGRSLSSFYTLIYSQYMYGTITIINI